MAFYSGQHGELYIKSADTNNLAKVGSLKNWSVNFTMNVLDTTCMQDTDRTILPGVRSFSGQTSLLYYQENASNVQLMARDFVYGKTGNTQPYDNKNFGRNTSPELSNIILRLNDGTSRDMSLVAQVTSFSLSCAVGEVVQAEFSFEGHGGVMGWGMIT